MVFKSLRLPGLALLALVAGAGMAAAWFAGLIAAGIVAMLVGIWAISATTLSARRQSSRPLPPAAAAAAPDRQALEGCLDASPLPLLLLDPNERLIALNRPARRLFAAEHLIIAPPAELIETIRATTPGKTARIELAVDDQRRPFALTTSDVAGALGSGRIAAFTDIEAELRAAEAATLRDLVRVLGHEIANTLTPIASLSRTAAEIVGDDPPDIHALREAVQTIARRAEGLQRFGQAYRQLSRLPAPAIAPFKAETFLGDIEALFRTRWPGIDFTCDASRAPATLHADRDQLHAAIWAVLQNAAEAASDDQPIVNFACHRFGSSIMLRIADNGEGVPAHLASDIFQPFITYKPGGTGIGLTLASLILRAHHGEIQVEPDQGQGAQFRIDLPA